MRIKRNLKRRIWSDFHSQTWLQFRNDTPNQAWNTAFDGIRDNILYFVRVHIQSQVIKQFFKQGK
jgi:hypothetical protein